MDSRTSSASTSTGSRTNLSCERCKRRKIKCDRASPACRTCSRLSQICSYPLTSQKPGPKPALSRRRSTSHSTSVARISSKDHQPLEAHDDHAIAENASLPPLSSTATTTEPGRVLTLSQLLHPPHEPMPTRSSQPTNSGQHAQNDFEAMQTLCTALNVSIECYTHLINAYFDNMAAFSLFHRPTIESKIAAISSPVVAQALLASIFSLSRRFQDSLGHQCPAHYPTSEYLRTLSERLVEKALQECMDEEPPIALLQALSLVTFQQLIYGVRGRAWRSLGTCVRLAYELQLHLVDKGPPSTSRQPLNESSDEEKRRLWWTIWEFDVFASTIRRLPTAIDWSQNDTWLPIDDDLWFSNSCARSCTLDPDPSVAWKKLQSTGSQCAKAWFIVVNAVMRSAHVLAYPQAYSVRHAQTKFDLESDSPAETNILANSLYCVSTALPANLVYHGEHLNFCAESLQIDAAKHSIHIMSSLTRFMVSHRQVFDNTSRLLGPATATPALQQPAWNHYITASSEIVTLIRNCAPRHVAHVNPFLTSTIWLAAAAQVVYKIVSPQADDLRLAESNLDLLRCNLSAFNNLWGVPATFLQKLNGLQTTLKEAMNTESSESSGRQMTQAVSLRPNQEFDGVEYNIQPHAASRFAPVDTGGPNFMDASGSLNLWPLQATGNIPMDFYPGSDLWGWGIDELLSYGMGAHEQHRNHTHQV